jgi:23S rRNA G2069 N7-methylase RlmK/C1962 C5-methylase RlmI
MSSSYADVAKEAANDISNDVSNAGDKFDAKLENDANKASQKAEDTGKNLKAQAKDAADKTQSKAKELHGDLQKAEKDAADKIKKEYDNHKGPAIDCFNAIAVKVSQAAFYVVNTTKSAASWAAEELKNPVVATQAVVAVGAIAGLIAGIQERSKIFRYKSDGEITAILAGLAGLVVLDGVLFNKYYPKYDKKSLK